MDRPQRRGARGWDTKYRRVRRLISTGCVHMLPVIVFIIEPLVMTAATWPVIASLSHRRAWIILMLGLFFGSLSLAAMAEIRVECANEYLTGGGKVLTGGGKPLTTGVSNIGSSSGLSAFR